MTTDRNSEGAVACMCCGAPTTIGYQTVYPFPDEEGGPEEVETYTYAPPATIPAAEVLALVERLRGLAAQSVPPRSQQDEGFRKATIYCADELAKLILRGTK